METHIVSVGLLGLMLILSLSIELDTQQAVKGFQLFLVPPKKCLRAMRELHISFTQALSGDGGHGAKGGVWTRA